MAKTVPNAPVTGAVIPSGLYRADFDGLVFALAGDGVLAGLGVSQQGAPDMTVAVAAGQARIGGYFPFVAAQNVTIPAADATNPRWHLVTLNYNGVVARVDGTAAAVPVLPDIPANSISLAKIFVPPGATAISNAGADKMVHDDRCVVPDWFDLCDDFLPAALATTGNISLAAWGTTAAGTAANAFQAGESLHPGILRLQTGTTSGNNSRIHLGASATAVLPFLANQVARWRCLLRIPTITTLAVKLGLGNDMSDSAAGSLGTAGAWVEFVPATSAKWRYGTRNASVSTMNADTGADVAANTWYQFDVVELQNGNWQFARNGVLQFTHSSNLPNVAVTLGALVHTLTAAARNIDIDAVCVNLAPLGNRWT